MSTVASRLRLGEKIALGFGLVILIFLGVIGHDQLALARLSAEYDRLHSVYGARQSYAFGIERRLNAMRSAQADFLITRSLDAAAEVTLQGAALDAQAQSLGLLDEASRQTAARIRALNADYLLRFAAILEAWRIKGLDEDSGLQGDFRRTAHELEALAGSTAQIQGLEIDVLQLRRREKDYLLRGRDEYVAMVDAILAQLREQVEQAPMRDPERRALSERILGYGRDFHALVDQDRRIAVLGVAMDEASARITPLVQANLEDANRLMATMTAEIAEKATWQGRRNLIIALAATLLGLMLAFMFTSRIVRSVRNIARLLDRLTTETPRERLPIAPGARDEIDVMAGLLNTLADHKTTFVDWWRTAMREAVAMRDLHASAETPECARAAEELRLAAAARLEQITGIRERLRCHADRIRSVVDRMSQSGAAVYPSDVAALREAASGLSVLSGVLEAESAGRSRPLTPGPTDVTPP
jgi:HAMP domain-containing protein/CHASE3 domain sensor protein